MMGEELSALALTFRGVWGDRAYALLDPETDMVVSAKNPKRWRALFDCHALVVADPQHEDDPPAVRILTPDGRVVMAGTVECDAMLSEALGRPVRLIHKALDDPRLEEYWPTIDGRKHQDLVTAERMPSGTFVDAAPVHLLSTATLNRLRGLYPDGRFEMRRFRPNVVVDAETGESDFVEQRWIGKTLAIGPQVRLKITGPCARCVMTTLPQGDLPSDPGILRTAVKHNQSVVGVYGTVVQTGRVFRGDALALVNE
jgi:uncharacterized protein YcbX